MNLEEAGFMHYSLYLLNFIWVNFLKSNKEYLVCFTTQPLLEKYNIEVNFL